MAKSYHEQLRDITRNYLKTRNQQKGWSPGEVALWAVRNNQCKMKESDVIKRFAWDLSEVWRHEIISDERGRPVRAKHATRTKQGTLWDDIRTAPRRHMELSFAQRRNGIVSDCCQLKNDVSFYNDHHPEEVAIQLVLDFNRDVAMKEMDFEDVVLN